LDKDINKQGTNDGDVLFGELSLENTITSLNLISNSIMKPYVGQLEDNDWGFCEEEQKKEFTQTFDKFNKELKEAIASLSGVIELQKYDKKWDKDAKNISNIKNPDAEMKKHFQDLFEQWNTKIEEYLSESDEGPGKPRDRDVGPRSELEYWRKRMQKLTCLSEEMRSPHCRIVQNVINHVSSNANDNSGHNIYLLQSKWRSQDMRVTEALNEAKDNVKYLTTLEQFIDPLYNETPDVVKDTLPALMNSIKMIHTIARYYNTNDRMTDLFKKITNQMITCCKNAILDGEQSDDKLWLHDRFPPEKLIPVLRSCIELNKAYQKQYEITKERLMNMPKGKQFEFSPNQIFGKFDLFCRRIYKLEELFGTIQQFETLGKHNLENMDEIIGRFKASVDFFRKKGHKLLVFEQNKFDRDFVEFNVAVSSSETELQQYICQQFEKIRSVEDSLKLLRKFRSILKRNNLRASLDQQYAAIIENYSAEIMNVEKQYQEKRAKVPTVRNLPEVAGAITWSRHLFHRISAPMENFPPDLINRKESKRQINKYNKTGYVLFAFESVWRQAWAHEVEKAKAGLQATLIIRHPSNNKLYVNFDSEILTLIREAKCLSRIGIEIPESAKIVLLQEDKFKKNSNELSFVLREYERIVSKIRPNTKSLLVPHLEDLEYKLRPGMVTLTWTSMNIEGYLHHVHAGLSKLEQLIININDIMENRIENNLKALSKTVLVNLPQDAHTFSLDQFVEMQEEWIHDESQQLKSKNIEVEGAVEDLIQTICSYNLDKHVEAISAEEIQKLSKYYNWSMYQALLHATKYSLNAMKERICGRRNTPKMQLKPFFDVDVLLDQGQCQLKPSLEDIQSAINRAASHVLKSTKNVQNWNQKDRPEEEREPFYDWIAKDKEIVKVILLLTGSIQGTKNAVHTFVESFEEYQWLWNKNISEELKRFTANQPQLEDYEEKLKEFSDFEKKVNKIQSAHQIGALNLTTDHLKQGLKSKILQWKEAFSRELHKKAKSSLDHLYDDIKQLKFKLQKPAQDIDTLGNIMHALEEIRKKESDIDLQFRPVTEMYNLLELNLTNAMDKDEVDTKSILEKKWKELVQLAETTRNSLQGKQSRFKKTLIEGVKHLIVDVEEFRKNFEEHGPMVAGIAPREALNRLRIFSEEYQVRKRRYESYHSGETLFGLPHQSYPALDQTSKEIELLEKLYNLYSKVIETIANWKVISWPEIPKEIDKMIDNIEMFGRDCARLPGVLKGWDAYKELRKEVDDMGKILPLVKELSKPSIRDRHWDEIIQMTQKDIPYKSETFTLNQLLDCNLLEHEADIEDITESADKQLKLENDLNDNIIKFWQEAELEIKSTKQVEQPCMLGGNIVDIQETLEEHIMQLNQMNAMRYVTPFKSEVEGCIFQYNEVSDTIEKWLKVQVLWSSLVSVFKGGDIAKNMPTEAKKFAKIDKDWLKLMERANEQRNVIQCCTNDMLKNMLHPLQEDLEFCQKKLESYLETKRKFFPRFYFVSNLVLLKILSQGSDPNSVQEDFEKLFDAISRVKFDDIDRRLITTIMQVVGKDTEDVLLTEGVKADGAIEVWLQNLEAEMQRSMRDVCRRASSDCFQMELEEFIKYQSQIALLGIQMIWTQKVQDALERNQKERNAEMEKKKKEIGTMMEKLTALCLVDTDSRIHRTKIETLVTIHVHQKDLFDEIQQEVKTHKINDASDFDWVKNTRIFWKYDEEHVGISITDVEFIYSYEFLGAKERLCITPLTDRCYVTLAQALGMLYGGAPAGPAGTGKTETVKDLGRSLGVFVVVTNCSGEHKYRDMAKIFKGLCQSGLWGCFDEFNRIALATLSVVAAQVEAITTAKKTDAKIFMFPNDPVPVGLVKSCAYFITMNPGYAGRQELPENLKVLFRGVTMMQPDRQIIIKVKLASVGYNELDVLSKKFTILYRLCEEQLSAQRHYDFGLRNILSVLRTAGNTKRNETTSQEEMLLARTLRDMNLSKLVAQDKELFDGLLADIFPKQTKIPKKVYKEVEDNVKILIKEQHLIDRLNWFIKIIQLYETSLVRHGFMLVGPAGSGKTTINNILLEALTRNGVSHRSQRMNPKSFTGQEMFGVMNSTTGEWTQGVFSAIWAKYNKSSLKHNTWITCDGPVDAIWIENLNTVLDDNKILTLANSDRIPMTDNTKLVFEVENLNNASPATVSRCGIVYVSDTDLGWSPLFDTWIEDNLTLKKISSDDAENMKDLVKKYMTDPDIFDYLLKNQTYVMYTPEVIRSSNLINLFNACLLPFMGGGENLSKAQLEKFFIYSLAWALGGLFEAEERERFHKYLESLGAPLPQISGQKMSVDKETVFDYYIKNDTKEWTLWEAQSWDPPKHIVFSQLLIPTSDSTRSEYIIQKIADLPEMRSELRKERGVKSTLIVGGTGTAKTSCALMYASKFNASVMLFKSINFSSATSPSMFQRAIDGEIEKKQGKQFGPPGGKKMTVFIDDMSMPLVNEWNDQITLEIMRQLIELKGYYFLEKENRGDFKEVESLQYVGAMNHPGGGRNDIPNRIKRHFFIFNMTSPSVRSIENIYGRIMTLLFNPKKYNQDVLSVKELLTDATITLWDIVRKRLLPTPTKFHYVFNIRELSRVFQGIANVAGNGEYKIIQTSSGAPGKMKSDLFLVALWRHECERVFEDKLMTDNDKKVFHDFLDKVTVEKFKDLLDISEEEVLTNILFSDFQRKDEFDEYGELTKVAPFVYEACQSINAIRKVTVEKLASYNEVNISKKMGLVIFDDALKHLLRLCRILNTKRGSAMLVGVGGSGKQSLTKLSSFICKQRFFQIALTKSYTENNLKENIAELYSTAGPAGGSVTFILTDAEIKTENFLEYINSFLATGEIAGLMAKDERDVFALESKTVYMKEQGKKGEDPQTRELWLFAINRVRDCLHMVLSFSPVGNKFAERARKFPALFSACTIDWFLPWPEEALISVSHSFLSEFPVDVGNDNKIKTELENHMGKVHDMVTGVCSLYFERMRRHVYVTPKSYLSFIDLYKSVYKTKYDGLNTEEKNIRLGLDKLKEAAEGIAILKEELAKEEVKLGEAAKKTDKLLKELEVENQKAKKKADEVGVVKQGCEEQAAQIAIEKADAERDLAQAMPYLEKAIAAVDSITTKDIGELRTSKSPADTMKMILDAVHIILQYPLSAVKIGTWKIAKQDVDFLKDSFDENTKSTLTNAKFLKTLQDFSEFEKDNINDETCELLEPYLNLQLPDERKAFDSNIAKKSNGALEGLCIWCAAMSDYHIQSKIVKPKLELLEIKQADQNVALKKLAEAEAELDACNQLKARLKKKYDDQMAEKQALQDKAAKTRRKMDQANRLINGLKDERKRWEHDANNFASLKSRLVGDVAKACAFVSYCGPFNAEFRQILLNDYFHKDLSERSIPCSEDLALTSFLVDDATVGEWNLQGLPSDDLSVQNAIMVTRSSRFPLLIDPQGQAMSWIRKREPDLEKKDLVFNINNPSLKDRIKIPLQEGWPVMIEGIENEVDPMLDPLLEKQIIQKTRTMMIKIADQDMDYDPKFMLYMTSRLANPHFSPELAAKTTIINFTVIQSGLEQQLLGRVLSKEQKSLEEQLTALLEDVTENTKTLQLFDKQLLERLANSQGSLLDDTELIDVLATIKAKSKEVNQKLSDAKEKRIEINEKREQFRPVAARGAVLYFCIVEMSLVSWMYNTSLYQFLSLFDLSIDVAPKAQLLKDRVANIIDTLTYKVYRYINRGLFEKDKITFKLMCSLKILIQEGHLQNHDIQFFLKAGAGGGDERAKQFSWMDPKAWSNLKALSAHRFSTKTNIFFKDLPDRISRNEPAWQAWIEENEPENTPIPDLADKISTDSIHHFLKLCLVRCTREGRTLLASTKFIAEVLGQQYIQPVTDSVEDLWKESAVNRPPLFLLSAGADPTNSIDEFAKRKKKYPTKKVSMGEEQDKLGEEEIRAGFISGGWVILQNCHLDLEFMAKMEEILNPKNAEPHEDFRLWIT
jgi:dynein heavy chain